MKGLFSKDVDGNLVIEPQAWLLEPFKAIQDKYKDQGLAIVEMCIVWYASDYRSDFLEGELHERIKKIKGLMYNHRHVKIDDVTYKAAEFYMEWRDTPKIKLIRSLQSALTKATQTINDTAMGSLDDIKLLSDIVSRLPNLIEGIDRVDMLIKKESAMDKKIVGAGEKGIYEDGL